MLIGWIRQITLGYRCVNHCSLLWNIMAFAMQSHRHFIIITSKEMSFALCKQFLLGKKGQKLFLENLFAKCDTSLVAMNSKARLTQGLPQAPKLRFRNSERIFVLIFLYRIVHMSAKQEKNSTLCGALWQT